MPLFSTATHILHIGANDGQETSAYLQMYAPTLKSITFIECIPDVYTRLISRLEQIKSSTHTPVELSAVQALCSDQPGQSVEFYIASNEGASSSMLAPNPQEWMWDYVNFPSKLNLTTTTVDTLVESGILKRGYDALVLDTQGSELKVLRGMSSLLPHVTEIITEYSRREFYKGGVLLPELIQFLREQGFEVSELPSADHNDMKFTRSKAE